MMRRNSPGLLSSTATLLLFFLLLLLLLLSSSSSSVSAAPFSPYNKTCYSGFANNAWFFDCYIEDINASGGAIDTSTKAPAIRIKLLLD